MNVEIVEQSLGKLDSVISCKIILGENNSIDEIHIVSNGSRNVKQIVRDVQSVLIATYNIQIDHKKISIAEIIDESLKRMECRPRIMSVSRENNGQKATIRVALTNQKGVYENSMTGINTGRNIDRILVDTTLRTVEEASGYEEIFILEDVKTVNISTDEAVLVVIICIENGQEQRLCGSSMIKNDYNEAVVKATLDAINRYITK
ncbi:hypothetical protein [Proteiniborus sp. MB09-C3]|uniref:hypothetical protein n=1 Tax=Proteiniborus sp. MB09-C3 TaxID=3050072 RepID=UPI0025526D49|nr:hypothetical protein [Proteiniborus sp. MB09-C3]WIV13826.1 hypothetical protein QO263_09045 [Proteiniborus sp. MB09-C3]